MFLSWLASLTLFVSITSGIKSTVPFFNSETSVVTSVFLIMIWSTWYCPFSGLNSSLRTNEAPLALSYFFNW